MFGTKFESLSQREGVKMITNDFNCERDLIALAVNNEKILAKVCTELTACDFKDLNKFFSCINEMYQSGKKG